jgi:hypothetical protein
MSNICINTICAEGTSKQVDEFIRQMSETFGSDLDINDNFETEEKAYTSLTLSSSWKMPQKELLEVTGLLPNTKGLYIRVVSEEPAEEYCEQSVFSDGKWSFENPPSINAQIHELTVQGLNQIRRLLQENGKLYTINEDDFWIALYVDNDGYGTSSLINSIELDNEKISLNLEDGCSLYEDELTTNHVLDILTIIEERHGTFE